MEGKKLWRGGYLGAVVALPLGVGMLIGGLFMGYYIDIYSILWNPLTPQGIVWIVLGLVALAFGRGGMRRLRRFKDDGLRYDADVTQILTSNNVNIVRVGGIRHSAMGKVDCVYVNERGEQCLVRSRQYIFNAADNETTLQAVVWVDHDDPAIYEVELFRRNLDFIKDYDKTYKDYR